MELVQEWVRALEPAGSFHVAMDDNRGDAAEFERGCIQTVNLGVPEAMKRKPWFPDLGFVIGKDKDVLGRRVTQWSQAEFSVFQDLSMVQCDVGAFTS
jgi:hypothetical protein